MPRDLGTPTFSLGLNSPDIVVQEKSPSSATAPATSSAAAPATLAAATPDTSAIDVVDNKNSTQNLVKAVRIVLQRKGNVKRRVLIQRKSGKCNHSVGL